MVEEVEIEVEEVAGDSKFLSKPRLRRASTSIE